MQVTNKLQKLPVPLRLHLFNTRGPTEQGPILAVRVPFKRLGLTSKLLGFGT